MEYVVVQDNVGQEPEAYLCITPRGAMGSTMPLIQFCISGAEKGTVNVAENLWEKKSNSVPILGGIDLARIYVDTNYHAEVIEQLRKELFGIK